MLKNAPGYITSGLIVAATPLHLAAAEAELDWKDDPKLYDSDGDHCVLVESGKIQRDDSFTERFLETVIGDASYLPTTQHRLETLEYLSPSKPLKVCLGETDPGTLGYAVGDNEIVINEDLFRYPYVEFTMLSPPSEIPRRVFAHESEHNLQHVFLNRSSINHDGLSLPAAIELSFAQEMLSRRAEIMDEFEGYFDFYGTEQLSLIARNYNKTSAPSPFMNEWLDNQAEFYACRQASHYNEYNISGGSELATGTIAALIDDQIVDETAYAQLKDAFDPSSPIRDRMHSLAATYAQEFTDNPPQECHPPIKGEYNLTDGTKQKIETAIYAFDNQAVSP